jgi:aryl-alcohol dehydrogenase-like predicted oxidoreductase
MKYNRLGLTPLVVSEIGFGCFAIGGDRSGNSYGATDDRVSAAAIEVALDLGCTFFDTADVYGFGHSESLLGETLKRSGRSADVVVATKVGGRFDDGPVRKDFSTAYIRSAVDASLRRLQRDTIDLYQLHDPPIECLAQGEAFDCLDRLVEEGKIRAYGVSIHSAAEAIEAVSSGRPKAVQAALNVITLIEPDNRPDLVLQAVGEAGLGMIAREPLASGFLAGGHDDTTVYAERDMRRHWSPARRRIYQALVATFIGNLRPGVSPALAAIRFVLDQPNVSTTIVGTKTPHQARVNFAACDAPSFADLMRADG